MDYDHPLAEAYLGNKRDDVREVEDLSYDHMTDYMEEWASNEMVNTKPFYSQDKLPPSAKLKKVVRTKPIPLKTSRSLTGYDVHLLSEAGCMVIDPSICGEVLLPKPILSKPFVKVELPKCEIYEETLEWLKKEHGEYVEGMDLEKIESYCRKIENE